MLFSHHHHTRCTHITHAACIPRSPTAWWRRRHCHQLACLPSPSNSSYTPMTSPSSADSLPSLVSVQWLAGALHLTEPKDPASSTSGPTPVVFDCSWYLPVANRDAIGEYDAGHIPGAIFFDVDFHADLSSPYPHMLPSPAAFSALLTHLHVTPFTPVICYDASTAFCASARVWWTFLTMGHPPDLLHLLDGGFAEWKTTFPQHVHPSSHPSPRLALPPSPPTSPTPPYLVHFRPSLVTSKAALLSLLASPRPPVLLDARDVRRFEGVDPEPRPAKFGGHIPGARSVWHVDVQTVLREGGRQGFVGREEVERRMREAGVGREEAEERGVVCYCGSGITAATVLFALWEVGWRRLSLYDASMAEWLNSDDTAVEKGGSGAMATMTDNNK